METCLTVDESTWNKCIYCVSSFPRNYPSFYFGNFGNFVDGTCAVLLVCLLRSRSTDMGKFETVGDTFWNIVSSFVEENYFVSWRIIYSFLIFLINHPLSLIPENFCQVLSLFRRRELIIFEEISFQNLQDCWWQSLVVKDSFFLNMNDAFNWSNRV